MREDLSDLKVHGKTGCSAIALRPVSFVLLLSGFIGALLVRLLPFPDPSE
jgi:hypothetical protein